MKIEFHNDSDFTVDITQIKQLGSYLSKQLYLHPETELSVAFLAEPDMEELHLAQLQEAGPTDVISVPMDELRPGSPEQQSPAGLLGDIAICPQVAQRQAEAQGHSTADEILLLTTHGVLHLLGYDHQEPEAHTEMFALQRKLLSDFLGRPAPAETVE